MPKITVINQTDETISIEPGESSSLFGEKETKKSPVSRFKYFAVKALNVTSYLGDSNND